MPNGQTFGRLPSELSRDFPGCGSAQLLLLDGLTANSKGQWSQWAPYHKGSLEVSNAPGAASMVGTVTLYGSNSIQQPSNGFTVTIGGTPAVGNTIQLKFHGAGFLNGELVVNYTVPAGSPTTSTVAAGLATAINAALAQAAIQYTNNLDYQDSALLYAATPASNVINIDWNAPLPPTTLTASATGGGATATIGEYDDGSGFSIVTAQTAVGLTVFDVPCQWIKAVLSGYSAGNLTAIVNAVFP